MPRARRPAEGEAPGGRRRGRRRGQRRERLTSSELAAPVSRPAAGRSGRLSDRRARQPRDRGTPARATTSASRSRTSSPSAGSCRGRARCSAGCVTEGRTGPGGPRVAVLLPQTYMNESGRAVGPARGQYRLDLDQVLVIHDEIDLPVRRGARAQGGGLAGHNGLKSVKQGLGSGDFRRVRVGVGRPTRPIPRSCPRTCCRASRAAAEVRALIERAADETAAVEPRVRGRLRRANRRPVR